MLLKGLILLLLCLAATGCKPYRPWANRSGSGSSNAVGTPRTSPSGCQFAWTRLLAAAYRF